DHMINIYYFGLRVHMPRAFAWQMIKLIYQMNSSDRKHARGFWRLRRKQASVVEDVEPLVQTDVPFINHRTVSFVVIYLRECLPSMSTGPINFSLGEGLPTRCFFKLSRCAKNTLVRLY